MIYYTSDLHFGHANVIKHCNRPFASVDEMDARLIENWNSRVHANDTVYILGDMFFRNKRPAKDYLRELKGHKHLLLGNHDIGWLKTVEPGLWFESVERLHTISDHNHLVTMCHYPMMTWRGAGREGYMVFGHIHNNTNMRFWGAIQGDPQILNAGVDINGYQPVTLEELIQNNIVFKRAHPVLDGRTLNCPMAWDYDVDDLNAIFICAVRYSIGRRTYMPRLVMDYIQRHQDLLTNKGISPIIHEIEEKRDEYITEKEKAIGYRPLGDACDEKDWLEFLAFLQTLKAEREQQ